VESQATQAQASMRAEYERQLAAIHQHQDQAKEQLRKVQAASGDAWHGAHRGGGRAWASMRKAFRKPARNSEVFASEAGCDIGRAALR